MNDHTYRGRFATVLSSVGLGHLAEPARSALLFGKATDALALRRLEDAFTRQTHADKELLLFCPAELVSQARTAGRVRVETLDQDMDARVREADQAMYRAKARTRDLGKTSANDLLEKAM